MSAINPAGNTVYVWVSCHGAGPLARDDELQDSPGRSSMP